MEWQDQRVASVLATNVRTLMLARNYENINQMHAAYRRWVSGKPYQPLALNWMRNIARQRGDDDSPVLHAPRVDLLAQLAEFLQVPVYMLFIEDIEGDPEFAMRMNRLIAAYVNGPETVRQAIDALVRVMAEAQRSRQMTGPKVVPLSKP